jgi:hypothetical protein
LVQTEALNVKKDRMIQEEVVPVMTTEEAEIVEKEKEEINIIINK